MIQSRVDVEPGSPPIPHTHPGEEIIYVPAGVIHAVRNAGTGTGTALATDIVDKGKPLLTVAHQPLGPRRAP